MSTPDFSFSQTQLREIANDIIRYARKQGATSADADVSEGLGQSIAVRKAEVETIEFNRDKGIGITVFIGQQRGYASTSDFSVAARQAVVDAALSIARFTAADPYAGLADEELMAHDIADLDLFHPWQISVEEAIELARECEAAAFDVSPKITNSEGASVSIQQSHFATANSYGFNAGYATSRHGLSCSVIAGEGDSMQREFWYDTRRDAADLMSAEAVGRRAGERALARLGAKRIRTCEIPVLFEAPLATGLIGSFVHAVSGGALYRRSSFLLDSLQQQIFPAYLDIVERPHVRKALGSSPFDSEGVATHDRDVVKNGVLQGYFLSSYSARKLGMQTTGNAGGSHNLFVSHGNNDLDGLIRTMDKGLLVTELLGHGINYVTGDYSRGAAGFWVENGRIAHPVEEIIIAGNLRDMFMNITDIGNDIPQRGAKFCGSILINRMKVAGK